MKKIFVMALVAIFTGIMFSACEKEDTLVKTKNTLCDKIPSYDQVINDMEESGYCKITDEMISNIIEKRLSPGYIKYSIYYNKAEKTYYIVTQYDSNDVKALARATGECDHIFMEFKDKEGNRYITCNGEGNTCYMEIHVLPGGEDIAIFIVTC